MTSVAEQVQPLSGRELAKVLDVSVNAQTGNPDMIDLINAALKVPLNTKLFEKLGEEKYKQVLETSANLLAHIKNR